MTLTLSKVSEWLVTALLGVLTWLGLGLYSDQKTIAQALTENSISIRVLAEKLDGYSRMTELRLRQLEQDDK